MSKKIIKAPGIYYATDTKQAYFLLDAELRAISNSLISFLVGESWRGDTTDFSQSNPFVSTQPPIPISSMPEINIENDGGLYTKAFKNVFTPPYPGNYLELPYGWSTPENKTVRLINQKQIDFLGIDAELYGEATSDVETPISILSRTSYNIEKLLTFVRALELKYVEGKELPDYWEGYSYWKNYIESGYSDGTLPLKLPPFDPKVAKSGDNEEFKSSIERWKDYLTDYRKALPAVVAKFSSEKNSYLQVLKPEDSTSVWNGYLSTWINIESLPSTGKAMQIMGCWDTRKGVEKGMSFVLNIKENNGVYQLRFFISTDGTADTIHQLEVDLPMNPIRKWIFVEAWLWEEAFIDGAKPEMGLRLNLDVRNQATKVLKEGTKPCYEGISPFTIGGKVGGFLHPWQTSFDGRIGCTVMGQLPTEKDQHILFSRMVYSGGGQLVGEMNANIAFPSIPSLLVKSTLTYWLNMAWLLNETSGFRKCTFINHNKMIWDLQDYNDVDYSFF